MEIIAVTTDSTITDPPAVVPRTPRLSTWIESVVGPEVAKLVLRRDGTWPCRGR